MTPLSLPGAPEAARAAQPAPAFCGDLLVTFGPDPRAVRRRGSAAGWEPASADGWPLWKTEPDAGWRGYALSRHSEGPWALWLIGDVVPPRSAPDSSRFLAEVASGRRAARELNGHLLLVGWNAEERRWHAWTDRFGTVHAYYATDGRRAALGTFFASVADAASSRRLDWPALAGFFACGFFPEDRTFFDDVRILRPATHSVFDADGRRVAEERYARWRHEPDRSRGYEDTTAELARLLDLVVGGGEASGRMAVPISGGLDSRTTVAAITRRGRPAPEGLWAYSYGYGTRSVETRIARRVAAARGLPFTALSVHPYLFERLPGILSAIEGFQDVTQARQAIVVPLLRERADSVLAAHWGDVWLDDMGVAQERDSDLAAAAFRKVAKRGREWLLREVAGPHLGGSDPAELARGFVSRELDRVAGIADPDFRVKAYKTEQWSFRWTLASLRMHRAGAAPKLPFYDTRLSDFFSTVPTEMVAGRRLQIDYLKRFAPDLARVTWQASGTDLFWYRHFDTWLLPWRAAKKAARLLGGSQPPERNWEVQFSGAGQASLDRALTKKGLRIHDLVAPKRIDDLLRAFAGSPLEAGRGYTVSMLLTFSSWLEVYG